MSSVSNSASFIENTVKKEINNEAIRRSSGKGPISTRVTATFTSGEIITTSDYNNLVAPLQVVNSSLPASVTQGQQINTSTSYNEFSEAYDRTKTLAAIPATSSSHGCNSSCTGLCYTGCHTGCSTTCYAYCKNSCYDDCTGDCDTSCYGSCKEDCGGCSYETCEDNCGGSCSWDCGGVCTSTTASGGGSSGGGSSCRDCTTACALACGSGCATTCYGDCEGSGC